MKILIYTTAFAPNVGGVETYVMLLAKGLATATAGEEPFHVTVATKTGPNGHDDSELPFSVVRQPGTLKLFTLLRQADVVHLAGPCLGPLLLAWLMRKRIVIEHHAYQAACPNGLFLREPMKEVCPGYFERGEYTQCVRCVSSVYGGSGGLWKVASTFPRRWLSNRAQQNVCVSAHVERRLSLPRSIVIYHGIPAAKNGDSVEPLQAASRQVTFGYVGRLVPEKNLITLVKASKKLADSGLEFRLKFVGDGAERARLEAAVQDAGLANRTTFTGFLTGEQLSAAAGEISVVVMPSIWEETFGLSALEYMKTSRPVLVADIGGLGEVVGDAGVKFKPGDAGELAREMRRFIEYPALLSEYGTKAKQRADFFSLERMIQGHAELYRGLSASAGAKSPEAVHEGARRI
jgi:glycosyltransferase involved in cell wall biosynthesis